MGYTPRTRRLLVAVARMPDERSTRAKCERSATLRTLAMGTTVLGIIVLLATLTQRGRIDALVAWPLSPFALTLFGLRRQTVGAVRSGGLLLASAFGLVAYADLFFPRHPYSTAVLNFIFVPAWHLLGCIVVLLLTVRPVERLWSRLTKR